MAVPARGTHAVDRGCAVGHVRCPQRSLAIRLGRVPSRVLRGRRLLTGDQARQSFLRSAAAESRQSGVGLELLPGLAVSRERETRHWLIWGSVGAGKTQTMLHLILAAIARGDGVLVLDDAGRGGESEIARQWQRDFPDLHFRMVGVGRGLFVASVQKSTLDLLPV